MANRIVTVTDAPYPIEIDSDVFDENPGLYAGLTEITEESEIAQIQIRITFVPPPSLLP